MRWTYFIESIEVFPGNTRENKIKDTLTDDVLYAFRKSLDGSIFLHGDDYTYLKTLESTRKDDKFTFQIYDTSTLYFTGEFTIYDCKFDDYKRTCEIKVTARDEYTAIQENEDIEINVVGTRSDIEGDVYSFWHFFLALNVSGDYGESKFLLQSLPTGFGQYVSLYVTELVQVHKDDSPPTGFNATPFIEVGDYYMYRRYPVGFSMVYDVSMIDPIEDDNWDYYWSGELVYQSMIAAGYQKPYNESNYVLLKLGGAIKYTDLWVKKGTYERANAVITQTYVAMPLDSVINKVLTGIEYANTVKSALLFGDAAELGKTLPSSYPTLPGTPYFIDISDFKRPNAATKTSKSITTFSQLINYLCDKHNARWFIDAQGYFRIENIAYFGITTTQEIDTDNQAYEYISNKKPNRVFMQEQTAWNEDFAQITLLNGSVPAINGVKESTETISMSGFFTDLDGMNQNLDELPDEGFVYVTATAGVIDKTTGFASDKTDLQNAGLSNANCMNDYYRYNTYQETFTIAGKTVPALSLIWLKKQELEFKTIPDKTKLFVTAIGIGKPISIEQNLVEEDVFNAEVIYE